eukprot:1707290-Prymnesium_polylepis.2
MRAGVPPLQLAEVAGSRADLHCSGGVRIERPVMRCALGGAERLPGAHTGGVSPHAPGGHRGVEAQCNQLIRSVRDPLLLWQGVTAPAKVLQGSLPRPLDDPAVGIPSYPGPLGGALQEGGGRARVHRVLPLGRQHVRDGFGEAPLRELSHEDGTWPMKGRRDRRTRSHAPG